MHQDDHGPRHITGGRYFRRVLLLIISCVTTLLLIELSIRIFVSARAGDFSLIYRHVVKNTNIQRADPIRNHALLEETSWFATGFPPGFEYCTSGIINSRGMNDELIPFEKPPGERRILVLGDSFVEGVQVHRKNNFCEILEQMLNRDNIPPVKVINAGVSSYSPILEYLYFREELHHYNPDLVILVFFTNDVFDDLRMSNIGIKDESGKLLRVPPGEPWISIRHPDTSPDDATFQNLYTRGLELLERPSSAIYSYLAALIYYRLKAREIRRLSPTPPKNDMFFILEPDPVFDGLKKKGWSVTRLYLQLLKEECAKHDASLMLAAAPIAAQVYGQTTYDRFFFDNAPTDDDQVELKRIADELEVRFVDLLNPLRNSGDGLYFKRDGHWTSKGHGVVARTFHPFIIEAMKPEDGAAAPTR